MSSGVAAQAGGALTRGLRALGRLLRGQVVKRVGGPARTRVVVLFGAVLALNGADSATVGAVAPQLEHALHIGNTKIGLLSSVALLVGAAVHDPVGLLVDRTKRMPLLAISIVLWSLASLFSAFAGSYSSLLLSRLALGAVTATAGPAIASLTGDYFPARERGRDLRLHPGRGDRRAPRSASSSAAAVASLITWRAAFIVLAIPGFFLARELWRTVPEPLRGGQSHLEPGVVDLAAPSSWRRSGRRARRRRARVAPDPATAARRARRRRGAASSPNPRLVLQEDPAQMSIVARGPLHPLDPDQLAA